DVPVAELLSDEHAASQRARIEMDRALTWPIEDGLGQQDSGTSAASSASVAEAAHTTTFHVVDGEGNGAAVTTSLGAQFYVIGDTGIHINNRMRMLALDEG